MRLARTLLLGASCLLPLALPAAADTAGPEIMETFDASGHGGFKSLLKIGQDGPWTGEIKDGAYVLTNKGTPGAVKYFTINAIKGSTPGALQKATVEVDVQGKSEGGSTGAGLIFGLSPERKTYLLFVVLGNGDYALLARGSNGVKPMASGKSPALHADASNRLSVKPDGEMVDLLINGQQVVSFKVQNGQLGPGAGIAAFGEGEFRFDNFALTEAKG